MSNLHLIILPFLLILKAVIDMNTLKFHIIRNFLHWTCFVIQLGNFPLLIRIILVTMLHKLLFLLLFEFLSLGICKCIFLKLLQVEYGIVVSINDFIFLLLSQVVVVVKIGGCIRVSFQFGPVRVALPSRFRPVPSVYFEHAGRRVMLSNLVQVLV